MQFLEEPKIYDDMRKPTSIEAVFPRIDLPISVYTSEGKAKVLKEKKDRLRKRDTKGNDAET